MTRRIFLALVVVFLLAAGALLGSIALDQPSRTDRSAVLVEAPREAIWTLLTELERYVEWNPYITEARGLPTEGANIELTFDTGDGSEETATAEVLIVNPMRKLEWRTRRLLPGILDREQIFRVIPAGPGRFRVVQDVRQEGLLALVSDFDGDRVGLQAMLAEIARLAPTYQSSSP